jgi:hypothetical protein
MRSRTARLLGVLLRLAWRDDLKPGARVSGPAVIAENDASPR